MKHLKPIIKLLSAQKVKQIDIIAEKASAQNKADLLYHAIRDNEVDSDEAAIKLLYDEPELKAEAYKKLKYRLRERLVNTLFFVDIQNYSRHPFEKAELRVSKIYAAYRIIYAKGLMKTGNDLLETVVKSCIKYDLLDYKVLIFKELRQRYTLYEYDQRKQKTYRKLYNEAIKHKIIRDKLEDFYAELGRKVTISKHLEYTQEIVDLEKEATPTILQGLEVNDFYTRYYTYNSLYFLMMFKNDIKAQSDLCDQAIEYFITKKGFSNLALFSFHQKKGLCYLAMAKYKEAIPIFDKCLTYKPKIGSISWLAIYNYKFSAAVLLQDYLEAYKIASHIMNNKAFKKIRKEFQQPWFIKEAFIHFLLKTKRIDIAEAKVKPLRNFRLGRFLNEVPDFSKDKKGVNITINIIQLLFFVLEKNYDKASDRLNALNQYSFRYLKAKEYVRPRTFIRMLQIITKENYNLKMISFKAQKYLNLLKENPQVYTEQSSQIEIIPFEELWKHLLDAFSE